MEHIAEMIEVGTSYAPHDRMEVKELERLAQTASEGMCTMNGDTAVVELTVRQFALLLAAASICPVDWLI